MLYLNLAKSCSDKSSKECSFTSSIIQNPRYVLLKYIGENIADLMFLSIALLYDKVLYSVETIYFEMFFVRMLVV